MPEQPWQSIPSRDNFLQAGVECTGFCSATF